MIRAVAKAIMNHYAVNPLLKDVLTGGLYYRQAPQDASSPYGVFFIVGVDFEETAGDADNGIIESEIQFNLFSETDDGGDELAMISEKLHDSFAWEKLAINGYEFLMMRRDTIADIGYVDEIWQMTAIYTLGMFKE